VAIQTYRQLGMMTATAESIPRLKSDTPSSDCVDGGSKVFKFPGKVSTDETGDKIFVSDSGHHRVPILAIQLRINFHPQTFDNVHPKIIVNNNNVF
jgi:hypothetical protein